MKFIGIDTNLYNQPQNIPKTFSFVLQTFHQPYLTAIFVDAERIRDFTSGWGGDGCDVVG